MGHKLFRWFGGLGLEGTGLGLAALGFHPRRRHTFFAGLVELTGGFLLALGLATPLAATFFVSVMFVAAGGVHVRSGFFIRETAASTTWCSRGLRADIGIHRTSRDPAMVGDF